MLLKAPQVISFSLQGALDGPCFTALLCCDVYVPARMSSRRHCLGAVEDPSQVFASPNLMPTLTPPVSQMAQGPVL